MDDERNCADHLINPMLAFFLTWGPTIFIPFVYLMQRSQANEPLLTGAADFITVWIVFMSLWSSVVWGFVITSVRRQGWHKTWCCSGDRRRCT